MTLSNTDLHRTSENRRSEILLFIKERNMASIAEMAARFAVSEMTVRRAVYRLCAVEKCDLVITDDGAKSSDLARLRKLTGVTVLSNDNVPSRWHRKTHISLSLERYGETPLWYSFRSGTALANEPHLKAI
jgi:spore coat polysaccharide biosynthesis predicted glycosyltransferase SpsG